MKDYWSTGVHCIIKGKDLYHEMWMPVVPRKGDYLWLSSLTRGVSQVPEALVSKVEWSMDQRTGVINAWVTVRQSPKLATSE